MALEHEARAPMRRVESAIAGRTGRIVLRDDTCAWADGSTGHYAVVDGPQSTLIVPVFEDGDTVLVRQWRYPWGGTSWEVPAGTMEPDEEPAACARRELEEEAGLRAGTLTPLGRLRPWGTGTIVQHLFLARDLGPTERRLELYERDMIVRRLPLADALAAAMAGEIEHAGSNVALVRAARLESWPRTGESS
jgi:ADP-ribose pyrophosphatase